MDPHGRDNPHPTTSGPNSTPDPTYKTIADKVVGDIEARAAAAYGLPNPTHEQGAELLVRTALDKSNDFKTRSDALFGLYHVGDASAIGPIAGMLLDGGDHEWLRGYAAMALGHIGGRGVVEPLLEAARGDNMVVKWFAVRALGHVKDPSAAQTLAAMLLDPQNTTSDTPDQADFRTGIERALGEIGSSDAAGHLVLMLQSSDENVRLNAAAALSHILVILPVESLFRSLYDPLPAERVVAAKALGFKGDTRVVEPLIIAMTDPEPWVRGSAAQSLGLLGDERALPFLTWVRENDTGMMPGGVSVREAAAEAVRHIMRAQGAGK